MPISATASHDEKHWSDVQRLMHRFIKDAGFDPRNVWTNDVTDRVSERIVGNIFSADVVVADISDLNPNVMLELGLRLASKKPTIVTANKGGEIPFDIRDFYVLQYPGDLAMLGMEEFAERLNRTLKSVRVAADKGEYTPFLEKVVVDVLAPQTRQLPEADLIIGGIQDISTRLSRLEAQQRRSSTSAAPLTSRQTSEARAYVVVVNSLIEPNTIEAALDSQDGMYSLEQAAERDDEIVFRIRSMKSARLTDQQVKDRIILAMEEVGLKDDDYRIVMRPPA